MSKNKPHIEFTKMSSEENWHTPKGYPTGIEQQILASDIDELKKLEAGQGCFVSNQVFLLLTNLFTIIGKKFT
tara:strand:- start:582 stop:800 length:219 start_codon:yes stop_codon:yes gene_type:complete